MRWRQEERNQNRSTVLVKYVLCSFFSTGKKDKRRAKLYKLKKPWKHTQTEQGDVLVHAIRLKSPEGVQAALDGFNQVHRIKQLELLLLYYTLTMPVEIPKIHLSTRFQSCMYWET